MRKGDRTHRAILINSLIRGTHGDRDRFGFCPYLLFRSHGCRALSNTTSESSSFFKLIRAYHVLRLLISNARQPKLAVQLSRAFNVPPKQFWPAVSIRTLYEANTLHGAVSSCTMTFIAWNFKLA